MLLDVGDRQAIGGSYPASSSLTRGRPRPRSRYRASGRWLGNRRIVARAERYDQRPPSENARAARGKGNLSGPDEANHIIRRGEACEVRPRHYQDADAVGRSGGDYPMGAVNVSSISRDAIRCDQDTLAEASLL
jgi:hypothetical protein